VIDQAGKSIVSASVRFLRKQTGEQVEAKTSATGGYLTKDLNPGEYEWTASKVGYATRTGVIIVPDSGDLIDIDPFILVQAGFVTGQVTDQSGKTVSGVEVAAFDLQNHFVEQTSTNADGNYAIQDLAPGRYIIKAQPPEGFETPAPAIIDVAAGVDTRRDFRLIPLPQAGSISGRVADQSGAGVNGARVVAIDARDREAGSFVTGPGGDYKIADLAPGEYTVSVTAPSDFQAPQPIIVTVEAGADRPGADFRLAPAKQGGDISGRVTDKASAGAPGRIVKASSALAPIAKDARTDGDGMYTITDLGGGVYTVEVVDAPDQPGYLPAHNVEVVEGAMTAGIDFSEDAVADFVGRLDDGRFSVESRISEEEADQAISLFSVVNLMLAGLSQRQVGNKSMRDILGVLNLYYGLQEGSLRDRFVFADSTALWLGLETELKELARELDRFQSDIDFLNREARRQFNLGQSNNVFGNVQFPTLFRRYVEIGSDPLLAFDINAADQSHFFDKTKIAQADDLLKSLKDLILQITRSLSKYGTSATRRVNEDWAKFEARALEVLQTVARERVTPDRSEQNTWVVLANLTDRNFDVEVAPYVALARHGGKLLNYAMEIYRETKDRLDEFGAQYLRNLFQRGNNKRDFWTEKIRAEATVIKRRPLSNWR
jgi:hypothetical protein